MEYKYHWKNQMILLTMTPNKYIPAKNKITCVVAEIKNPELLILDDALSAVDAKTEEAILHNLKEIRKEKTTIIAAHRLSSVMHAKEIIVVDQGKIIERGTHIFFCSLSGIDFVHSD